MPKRNRSTLKNYFRQGAMPSSEHFADLIDSCVNQVEEGFSKQPNHGLQLTALDRQHLLSFYQRNDPNTPLWSIAFGKQQDHLQIIAQSQDETNEPVQTPKQGQPTQTQSQATLTITRNGNIGIQSEQPEYTLDVNGTIASKGRFGTQLIEDEIPADGQWHDLTPELEGCHMFEIVAGVGIRGTGHYALLHAIAINTCSPSHWWNCLWHRRNPIHTQQGFYRSGADKIKLRWKRSSQQGRIRPYILQIRTNTCYQKPRIIRYHITQLWQDEYMMHCQPEATQPQDDA
ncbi:MAG: hypothetical protein CENE_01742 [Candidatus Celerinatantimonas neptuna]|nr:MAG: hypothetical protein CENE_01742 [Candidatus Celerinatantimonas neptuna]